MSAMHPNPLGLSLPTIAVKLLAHGPLTGTEFADITGWTRKRSHRELGRLVEAQRVGIAHHAGKRQYRLIDGSGGVL